MFGKLIFLVQMTLITGNLTGCSNLCEERDLFQSEVMLSSDRTMVTTPAIAILRTDENGCRFLDVHCASAADSKSSMLMLSSYPDYLRFEYEALLQCSDEDLWTFGGNNTVYSAICSYDFI